MGATEAVTCTICAAGQYTKSTGSTFCSKCTAGKFFATTGSSSPNVCFEYGTGQYSTVDGATSSATCLTCVPGTYAEIGGLANCRECESGTYSMVEGAVSSTLCTKCAAGLFSGFTGADSENTCVSCGKGTYSQEKGASSDATCIACTVGKFSPNQGASICTECPATNASCAVCLDGKYLPATAPTSLSECLYCEACECNAGFTLLEGACKACPLGSFKTASGDSPCNLCQKNSFTPAVASTTCMNSKDGYMLPEGSIDESACRQPPSQLTPLGPDRPKIEFQVTLSYSVAGFTALVQAKFKEAIASVANAGCTCAVAKEDVSITHISEVSRRVLVGRPPASRRLLATSESINVDVSIAVPNDEESNLLVQNNYLTKDVMNEELAKNGVSLITHVTISPMLKTTAGVPTLENATSGHRLSIIIGGAVAGCLLLIAMSVCMWHRNRDPDTTVVSEDPVLDDMNPSAPPLLTTQAKETNSKGAEEGVAAENAIPHIAFIELSVEEQAIASGSFKFMYKARWQTKDRNVALLELQNTQDASPSLCKKRRASSRPWEGTHILRSCMPPPHIRQATSAW